MVIFESTFITKFSNCVIVLFEEYEVDDDKEKGRRCPKSHEMT